MDEVDIVDEVDIERVSVGIRVCVGAVFRLCVFPDAWRFQVSSLGLGGTFHQNMRIGSPTAGETQPLIEACARGLTSTRATARDAALLGLFHDALHARPPDTLALMFRQDE